jgi:hypothetical protein
VPSQHSFASPRPRSQRSFASPRPHRTRDLWAHSLWCDVISSYSQPWAPGHAEVLLTWQAPRSCQPTHLRVVAGPEAAPHQARPVARGAQAAPLQLNEPVRGALLVVLLHLRAGGSVGGVEVGWRSSRGCRAQLPFHASAPPPLCPPSARLFHPSACTATPLPAPPPARCAAPAAPPPLCRHPHLPGVQHQQHRHPSAATPTCQVWSTSSTASCTTASRSRGAASEALALAAAAWKFHSKFSQ